MAGSSAIGRSIPRTEDFRLLVGAGCFGDDVRLPGETHAAMVRSPHPHARIRSIDTVAARAMPGVLVIITGADCAREGLKPIPHAPVPSTRYDMKLTAPGGGTIFVDPHRLLPTDRARHAGEAVAMVIAETREAALDAAECVIVDYEPLAFVVDAAGALAPGASSVWDEAPGNLLVDTVFGDEEAVARGFAAAHRVVERQFHVGRVAPLPLEPRAGIASYDAATGRSTLQLCTGGPGVVRQKRDYTQILGIAPDDLRLVAVDTGGSFGAKNRPYVEFGLILWAAKKLGRPVRYAASRSESFVSEYQGRDLVTNVALAVAADGKFLALKADNIMNVGAHCVSLSPLAKGAALVTGTYDIPAARVRARAVFTNTTPNNVMRSSGRPEVCYALERIVDEAALEMGLDRIALRRLNLVRADAMPYANPVGARYDSGDYAGNMDIALRLADRAGFEARRRAAEARGRLLGWGFANYVESSTGSPKERAEIAISPSGRVRLVAGAQPSGQGHETSLAQIAAAQLFVPVEAIDVILSDTDVVSEGGGSHSGRSMRHCGTVIAMTAEKLIEKGKRLAAVVLNAGEDQVSFAEGRFTAPTAERSLDFLGLAAALGQSIEEAVTNEMHEPVFPNGAAVCEAEVDPETGAVAIVRYGAVDDVGRAINPMTVDGQTHGSIAHGVGEALCERIAVDPQSGQTLSGSFLDYAMPLASTLPSFATAIVENPSPTNRLGLKSASEGATTAAPAAVINAIADALSMLGLHDIPMPATPLAVWRAIGQARAKAGGAS